MVLADGEWVIPPDFGGIKYRFLLQVSGTTSNARTSAEGDDS
jgi:hypothetical protein